ncbi:putative oxidoreductase [Hyphodiscus hymeniophilus]|uniref:Oxidoreductase n=1 Tax=Hyphodiscus hymeniophilus TaxID=353542 RepID=A0A9P6VRW2_9HELO|nr:putative oxidoreductase [Hyphodiscus hymeniophilus]
MSANISQILIIGATSGIGEAFAKHFHSQGKKVIAAGRRVERLNNLKAQLAGLQTVQLDVENIDALETNLNAIIKAFPDLDSIFVMAGKMEFFNFTDPSTSTSKSLISEATTNFIAPLLIARSMIPHLHSLKRPTTFITVTSGLAFVPVPLSPMYSATKAAIHTFSVILRAQCAGSNVNVVELVPPYVDTDLDSHFRDQVKKLQGDRAMPPMPLQEYMEKATAIMDKGGEKEVAVGFAEIGVGAWRGAFGPIMQNLGISG